MSKGYRVLAQQGYIYASPNGWGRYPMSNPFAVDLRALASLRIAVGLLIIADLLMRWSDVGWFMSEVGAYPLAASKEAASDWRFSLYWLFDSLWWVHSLFVINLLVGLMLIAGVRTRVMSWLAFVLLASLHTRNPILLQGGDNLLLVLIVWGLFLPWGARFSVDAAMTTHKLPHKPPCSRYASVSSAALLIQVLSVYFFSALLKTGVEWTTEGTAIYYALHYDHVAHLLAPYWRDWHWLTIPLTHYVWWLELVAPLLVLSPWLNNWTRSLAALGLVTLEIGFLLNLNVGLFPFISMSSLLILIPGPVWDALARRFAPHKQLPMVMYYDEHCHFCHKTCVLIRAVFALNARIEPAQHTPEIGALLEREFSWVLVRDGVQYLRWEALVVAIANGGRCRWMATFLRGLGPVGDPIYQWIGEHRAGFGLLTQWLMPWRQAAWLPGLGWQAIAAGLAVIVFVGNVASLPKSTLKALPSPLVTAVRDVSVAATPVRQLFRADQLWNMFAPYPQKNDGWLLMMGLTTSGQLVDVLRRSLVQPTGERPAQFIPDQAKNYRWRKYLTRIKRSRYRDELGRFAAAACDQWNADAGQKDSPAWPVLEAFNIYNIKERTPPMGEAAVLVPQVLWREHCIDSARLDEDAVKHAMIAADPATQ